jgi:transposase
VDVILNGKQLTVQMFCIKLRASGAIFVACYPTQKQEAFLTVHQEAFGFFGGITYDNLKTAVKKVLVGHQREEQRGFIAFRSHHVFKSNFCTPGIKGAHEKGGVENLVGYARRNFLVPLLEVANF